MSIFDKIRKNGSVNKQVDSRRADGDPELIRKSDVPVTVLTDDELKNYVAKETIDRRTQVTSTARFLLTTCVIFIFLAYTFEIVSQFLPESQVETDARNILTLIQYVTAGLMGYLFGQSNSQK